MIYGWTGKILRVNLTTRTTTIDDVRPYTESFIGGSGINVKIVYDELDKNISPFDPENIICIGAGVLTGSPAPASARSSITAMSPRGLLDSSGIGGFIGAEIKFAGYDHIIIQGKSDQPVYLNITNDGVEIKDAHNLWGKDPWQTQQMIREELGDRDVQCLSIGQAGENLVHFACVITGKLSSTAGRCGMGAIMGSKNLKAVAVRGKGSVAVADPDKYLAACLDMHKAIRESTLFESRRGCFADKTIYERYLKEGGKFVSGNWEDSNWAEDGFYGLLEDSEKFWKEEAQHLQPKGARQPGCFGCPIYHETYFKIPETNDIGRTKCMEWISFGGTVWMKKRKDVIQAAYLCNKYGLDAASTGNCISFLMELYHKGLITKEDTDGIPMKRGDISAVKYAIQKIARQEDFGQHFKKGVAAAAGSFGKGLDKYAMQIKGLELFPIEIRAYKSTALLACVGKMEQVSYLDYGWTGNPEGNEKTAEELFGKRSTAIPNSYENKADLVVDSENRHYIGDMLGICKMFIPWGLTQSYKSVADLLSLATGKEYSEEALIMAAKRVKLLERAFNAARGIRRTDEKPPLKLFKNAVPDGKFKGEVLHPEQFENMLTDYYRLLGCDEEGIPQYEAFENLGMESEWEIFKEQINHDKG